MIGTVIVYGSIALAALYGLAWWLKPGLRRAIEAPKHGFAARVRQYDDARRSQDGRQGPPGAP
jgi:hypothetical protein